VLEGDTYPLAVSHPLDANSEFNLLSANLVVQAGCQFILDVRPRGCTNVEYRPCGVAPREGTIMTKSLLTGMVVCAALAVFAGNADAYKAHAHKADKTTPTWTTGAHRGSLPDGPRVNTGPYGIDPLYESCDEPWKYPAYGCPGRGGGQG
jgi:hypothetical protein